MFPAAVLALTMVVAVGMLTVAPPPQISAQDRARVAADALLYAQARAIEHCRVQSCAAGTIRVPGSIGSLTPNVSVSRLQDGTIVTSWRDGNNLTNWSQSVRQEDINAELRIVARRAGLGDSNAGPAVFVLSGMNAPPIAGLSDRQPVAVLRLN